MEDGTWKMERSPVRSLFSKVWSFYKSQFPKVYLPYIICICVIAGRSVVFPSRGVETSRFQFFGHVVGYKMFFTNIIESYGFHFWFLSTIFQFYLLFPLLASVFTHISNRYRWLFVVGAYVISVGRMFWIGAGSLVFDRVWTAAFPMFLGEFALGMRLGEKLFFSQTTQRNNKNILGEDPVCHCEVTKKSSFWVSDFHGTEAIHKASQCGLPRSEGQRAELAMTSSVQFLRISTWHIVGVTIICFLVYIGVTMYGGYRGRALNDIVAIGRYGGLCLICRRLVDGKKQEEMGIDGKKLECLSCGAKVDEVSFSLTEVETSLICGCFVRQGWYYRSLDRLGMIATFCKLKIKNCLIFLGQSSYLLYLRHGFLFLLFLRVSAYRGISLTRWWVLVGVIVITGVVLGMQYLYKKFIPKKIR